jgi:hypothetical protein
MFFAEHIFLGVRMTVRYTLSKLDSPGLQKQRKERFRVRREYLAEALGKAEAEHFAGGGVATGEKFDRNSLEEAARESTLQGHGTPEERFWQRQQGARETIEIGRKIIARVSSSFHIS